MNRVYGKFCSKCGKKKENKKRAYCKKCCSKYYYANKFRKLKPRLNNDCKNFINLIESRGGGCSIKELMVDLITNYNSLNLVDDMDHLKTHIQLMNMYKVLKNYLNKDDHI